MTVRRMIIIATMITITVALEQFMAVLPNIQLTIVLLMVFISVLNLPESLILVLVYTILDNIIGGISIYFVPMLFAWSIYAVVVYFLKSNHQRLIIFGAIFPIFFSIVLGVPYIIINGLDPLGYFIADIPFTVIFIVNNLLTVAWLYPILQKTLVKAIGGKHENLHKTR
jgi:energy-coupling factor transport system substrate-specific component